MYSCTHSSSQNGTRMSRWWSRRRRSETDQAHALVALGAAPLTRPHGTRRGVSVNTPRSYWPRWSGATPAKVRKSIILKSPVT